MLTFHMPEEATLREVPVQYAKEGMGPKMSANPSNMTITQTRKTMICQATRQLVLQASRLTKMTGLDG